VIGRSPISTVSAGVGKAILRPSPIVLESSTEFPEPPRWQHVVQTGSIPAIYGRLFLYQWQCTGIIATLAILKHMTFHNYKFVQSKRTSTSVQITTPQYSMIAISISTGRDTIFVRNENCVSRGFRCSPKATDKPNVAVNNRQNYSPGTEFTYSRDRKWRASDLWQLQKSIFCHIGLTLELTIKFQRQCRNKASFRR